MQPLGPLTSSRGTVYTAAQVAAVLLGGVAQENWLFYRLNAEGVAYPGAGRDISAYVQPGAQITHDATSAVKRSFQFTLRGDAALIPWRDQVSPVHQILMPDGGYVGWSMGKFPVMPPNDVPADAGSWLSYTCQDYSQLLVLAGFTQTYTVTAGTDYIAAIQSILSSYGGITPLTALIPTPGKALPSDRSWDAGQSRLGAINDLLASINYFPIWVDETGTFRSSPIPDWNYVLPGYSFNPLTATLKVNPQLTVDVSKVGNQARVLVEDNQRATFSAFYENDNPLSPTSVPSLGYPIMLPLIRDSTMADAAAAYARAKSAVQAASHIYAELAISTFPWALSQDNEVYGYYQSMADEPRALNLYQELGWTHTCQTGADTQHTWLQLVPS